MVNLTNFGFSENIGQDYARLTYRFFKEEINDYYGTAEVFPSETLINQLVVSHEAFGKTVADKRLQHIMQKTLHFQDVEVQEDVDIRV